MTNKTERIRSSRKSSFDEIYKSNIWAIGGHPRSGAGSSLESTSMFRKELVGIIRSHEVKSICDIGCGDMTYMPSVLEHFPNIRYTGVDIVDAIIDEHREHFSDKPWAFQALDIVSQPVEGEFDLVNVKEVLLHLSDDEVHDALKSLRKIDTKLWLISCHTGGKKSEMESRSDGRFLDITMDEFGLPEPIRKAQWTAGCQALLFDSLG